MYASRAASSTARVSGSNRSAMAFHRARGASVGPPGRVSASKKSTAGGWPSRRSPRPPMTGAGVRFRLSTVGSPRRMIVPLAPAPYKCARTRHWVAGLAGPHTPRSRPKPGPGPATEPARANVRGGRRSSHRRRRSAVAGFGQCRGGSRSSRVSIRRVSSSIVDWCVNVRSCSAKRATFVSLKRRSSVATSSDVFTRAARSSRISPSSPAGGGRVSEPSDTFRVPGSLNVQRAEEGARDQHGQAVVRLGNGVSRSHDGGRRYSTQGLQKNGGSGRHTPRIARAGQVDQPNGARIDSAAKRLGSECAASVTA